MSGKRYPGELKIEAVKQVVDRDLPPELTPGMILATSALGRKRTPPRDSQLSRQIGSFRSGSDIVIQASER